jgi:hypothetical protein
MRYLASILTSLFLAQGGIAHAEAPGTVLCSRLCWMPMPHDDASIVCMHKIRTDEELKDWNTDVTTGSYAPGKKVYLVALPNTENVSCKPTPASIVWPIAILGRVLLTSKFVGHAAKVGDIVTVQGDDFTFDQKDTLFSIDASQN